MEASKAHLCVIDSSSGSATRSLSARLGSHPIGLWIIKHLVSPIDRFIVLASKGRLPPLSRLMVPTLLLTVVGRRSGQERTTPLVFVHDGERFIVCNVRPAGERRNPWVINLRASGQARIELGGSVRTVRARELEESEVERWWKPLTAVWPAFEAQKAATGERSLFALEPVR